MADPIIIIKEQPPLAGQEKGKKVYTLTFDDRKNGAKRLPDLVIDFDFNGSNWNGVGTETGVEIKGTGKSGSEEAEKAK